MQDLDDGSISNIDWNSVEKWKPFTQEEVLLASHKNHLDFEITTAKLDELKKWENHNVYDIVDNENQKFVTLRWVISEKYVNGKNKVKARLVARGFQEDNHDILSDSPTCNKESMRLVLNLISSFN